MPVHHRPATPVVTLVACLACALTACGSGRAPGGLAMAVDTVGDTIHVTIHGGSAWGDTAELVPEVTIGAADGPDEYLLGRIGAIAVGPSGEIYVVDLQVPALRKYDRTGTYVATLGREGTGPGEYRRPDGGLAVLSDGRVVLRDPGNSRFEVYGGDGRYLGQWEGLRSGFSTSRPMVRTPDDAIYTMILPQTDLPPWEWTFAMLRFNADGTPGDTLMAPTYPWFERPMIRAQRDGSSSSNGVPFSADRQWTMLPNGTMVGGVATAYSFTVYDRTAPRRITKADWTPVPVLPEEAAERERAATENMRSGYPGWTWNGPPIPGTKPAYTDLYAGEDGRIWVHTPTPGAAFRTAEEAAAAERVSERPELRFREPVAFDVFEEDGRYLGHVRAPDGLQLFPQPIFRGDTVWALREDPETGVPQVVRFRVRHPE